MTDMYGAEPIDRLADAVAEAIYKEGYVQVEISARHVHLSRADLERLFGPGAELTPKRPLSQPGQYLAKERVALIGPKGRRENVAVLGPVRNDTQIELAKSDAAGLGVFAPVRESGDIKGSGQITLEGPAGTVTVPEGVIAARSHIHIRPEQAAALGLTDKQRVSVEIGGGRPVVFREVVVRVSSRFKFRMHIDFDEANAALVGTFTMGKIMV